MRGTGSRNPTTPERPGTLDVAWRVLWVHLSLAAREEQGLDRSDAGPRDGGGRWTTTTRTAPA